MAARTKVRSKRRALPFVAPEEHYATKADVIGLKTELKTDIANLRTELKDTKSQIIMWVAGLQLASIGIIIAILK